MADAPITVTIYHNPACGTSRNVLTLIRNVSGPNVRVRRPKLMSSRLTKNPRDSPVNEVEVTRDGVLSFSVQ